MSRTGEITLDFGDEERTFRLGVKELRKLQEKCADKVLGERGPFRIFRDLQNGEGRVDDIIQPILIGLVGGGMKTEDAARLVREHVEDRPLHENTVIAMLVLNAAISGHPVDKIDAPGGEQSGENQGLESPSASPGSMPTARSSDGAPASSTS